MSGGNGFQGIGAVGQIGELYITDSDAYSKSISDVTPTLIDGINEAESVGSVVINGAAGTIQLINVGLYTAVVDISFSLSNGAKVDGELFADGVLVEKARLERDISTPFDVGSAPLGGVIRVTGDPVTVDFRVLADAAGRTMNIKHLNFRVFGIG
jgi:hypothetical protein